jgi:hypothetical protein
VQQQSFHVLFPYFRTGAFFQRERERERNEERKRAKNKFDANVRRQQHLVKVVMSRWMT